MLQQDGRAHNQQNAEDGIPGNEEGANPDGRTKPVV
jgi:hypothetical protein